MRLDTWQIETIKRAVRDVMHDISFHLWLFGSRVDDTQRGGDIDLFIETDIDLPNRAEAICAIYARIIMSIGDRRIDVLVKDRNTPEAPVFTLARQTGILL